MQNPPLSPAQRARLKTEARPRPPSKAEQEAEKAKCAADPVYFISTYCKIYDNDTQRWIPFTLWPFQESALREASLYDEVEQRWVYLRLVALKTRQIGFTWLLADAHKLWKMLFRPITEVLVFSQSDEDAMAVLSEQRFKGMYKLLPDWMKIGIVTDSAHEFRLSNGSGIRALPESRGGDSRTVTDVVIDEADLIVDLGGLIARAEPTLGTKGQMIVIGRSVKDRPNSAFKRLYLQAKKGQGTWNKAIFVAWFEHPGRTQAWKAQLDRETLERTGSLDFVQEHYPSTDLEALSARSQDKFFPPDWIIQIHREMTPLDLPIDAPVLPGLRIFSTPEVGHHYGIGVDPAGGITDGDDAVADVVDADTHQQVATLSGKINPTQFGEYVADLSDYYFSAPALFELNNHGHAVRAVLKERGVSLRNGMTKHGPSRNPGWLTTEWSKKLLYDTAVKVIQQQLAEAKLAEESVVPLIFDFNTATQLASVDANELSAPEGQHDDFAMAWVLAQMCVYRGVPSMSQQRHRGLWGKHDDHRILPAQTGFPAKVANDKLAQLQAVSQLPLPAPQTGIVVTRDVDRSNPLWALRMRIKEPPSRTRKVEDDHE